MIQAFHRFLLLAAASCVVSLAAPPAAVAIGVDRPLPDQALEARARAIHKQLRCLVCQNQSIDDSNADLARDLRVLVRERISLGDSDAEVLDFVVDRYGDWVLLDPPLNVRTFALWLGPAALLLLGAGFAIAVFRPQRRSPEPASDALTPEERARVKALLERDGDAS
ncbi:MAG: cytochrome c-type biogenesis protein CcmH [Rhodospirillaceae bacterium]|nr:cytochrome c-type biogenesis protein CcmH [Rhodospirillaceae bacterium]